MGETEVQRLGAPTSVEPELGEGSQGRLPGRGWGQDQGLQPERGQCPPWPLSDQELFSDPRVRRWSRWVVAALEAEEGTMLVLTWTKLPYCATPSLPVPLGGLLWAGDRRPRVGSLPRA